MLKSSSPTATGEHGSIKGYAGHMEYTPHPLTRISTSCRAPETKTVGCRTELEQWLNVTGVLPSAYYSTNDQASFKEFLTRCDVLIASLPSTPKTRYLLTADHLSKWPLPGEPRRRLRISQSYCQTEQCLPMSVAVTWCNLVSAEVPNVA
jgi:hypothetical protein